MIETRIKALEQLEDSLSTTLRLQGMLRQKRGKIPELLALPRDLHPAGLLGHHEDISLSSLHSQLHQSPQIRALFLHRWIFSETKSNMTTTLEAMHIVNLLRQRGKLKTPWVDRDLVIGHHGLIKIFGQNSAPSSWPDIDRALDYIETDEATDFVKPGHLMWHLAAVELETQLGRPPPLEAVVAAHVTNGRKTSSRTLTPEQKATALAEMVGKEQKDWYFDYHLFSEEVCSEIIKIFLAVAGTHYSIWKFDESSRQVKIWQLSKMLTKRNDFSNNPFGVLRGKLSRLLEEKGQLCVSEMEKEMVIG